MEEFDYEPRLPRGWVWAALAAGFILVLLLLSKADEDRPQVDCEQSFDESCWQDDLTRGGP